jgi:ribosomal protein S18 acetylase RimI-like enzyme
VISYRPFLNFDSPSLVNIWRQQPAFRGLYRSLTRDLLDYQVFSKPYFEREGLILAFEDGAKSEAVGGAGERVGQASGQALGFIHAGFAPNSGLDDLDLQQGVIAQLKLIPSGQQKQVAAELIRRGLDYLRSKGARRIHVGSHFPHTPFYLGLYGGSRVPGILEHDHFAIECLLEAGFRVDDEVLMLERQLSDFRPPVDREQLAHRRQFNVQAIADPMETNWWECCQFSMAEREKFTLCPKSDRGAAIGSVAFWDMQPLASEVGGSARGLYDLHIENQQRRSGLATFLVSESLKQLSQQGIGRVEVQVRATDPGPLGLFRKLGFSQIAKAFQMSLS